MVASHQLYSPELHPESLIEDRQPPENFALGRRNCRDGVLETADRTNLGTEADDPQTNQQPAERLSLSSVTASSQLLLLS